MAFRITIFTSPVPDRSSLNDKLMWFGGSLGLFSKRDKDKSCFRIFIELLKHARNNTSISSDELAEELGLSRGTVIHHINKLIDSGIIVVRNNRYFLSVSSLTELVEKMHEDLERSIYKLKNVAQEIDDTLKL